jgi:hypothetical protein
MKILRVADNNGVSEYECKNEAEAVRERGELIRAYGYTRAKGFTRSTARVDGDNRVIFQHAVHSTVVFTIQ